MSNRCKNTLVRLYVESKEEFKTHKGTIFAEYIKHANKAASYVVYSYGHHFPMYIYTDKWYGNSSKYSVTTSKHQSLARPRFVDITWLNTVELNQLINNID